MLKYLYKSLFTFLGIIIIASSCNEQNELDDQEFGTDIFKVLKISQSDTRINNGIEGIPAYQLSLEIVFSHDLNTDILEGNLSITPDASYSISYDSSNSVATLDFDLLNYVTDYTLTLPAAVYGASGETLQETFTISFKTRPFITPDVTLAVENGNPTEGTSTTVTALLSEITTEDVSVTIEASGSATSGEDYALASTTIVIPVDQLSATISLDIIDDALAEGAENIQISIVSIENGNIIEAEPLNIAIVDNDVFTDLEIKGVFALRWSTEASGNSGKAMHFRATADIADLSIYAIGVANNGGGTDSIEYRFPSMMISAGEDILLARDDATLLGYFGAKASEFEYVIQTDEMSQNGDDAIELYSGTAIIETYGDVDVDGTGQEWEYTGSWAYKFKNDDYYYGGVDCAATSTSAFDSDCTYPLVANALQFQGVMSFEAFDPGDPANTNRDRAIHLRANRAISDLSVYGIGIANNGGGSDGREIDLPEISVEEGDQILLIRDDDTETIASYFGNCFSEFDHTAGDDGINFNGDDGVELFLEMESIEIYGDLVDDGTGLFWEYTGSWAVKEKGDVYTYGGANCAEFAETNASSACPYAFCE